jgi:hypothetical protein
MNEEEKSKEIVPVPPTQFEKSIVSFNSPLAEYLGTLGLPVHDVLYPISERRNIINALESALEVLPIDQREKAYYLTKFTVAVAVGLFDGALNYLWDQTISALRRLVLSFDLIYFFSVEEKINSRYKNLSNPDDLDEISDHDLLEACRRIGLLSDVNYKRLEHVNFMRNHASAAHPTEHDIDGFEMLGWLRVCLRHAITAVPDHSVITIKRLIDNIRAVSIPPADIPAIGADISKQPQERIDDFLWAIFGMYTDPKVNATAKANISALAKYVWDSTSDDRKYEVGARFGVFRKNADITRKDATQEFLESCDGLRYKDEDSLAGELIEKLQTLKSVHYAINNFYNEYVPASSLESSFPLTGKVPRSARSMWVKVLSTCFIGNGYGYKQGVDESALPYYSRYVGNFSEAETVEFLRLFKDPEFTSPLSRTKCDIRTRKLATILKGKYTNTYVQKALDLIIKCPEGKLDILADITEYKAMLSSLPKYP